MTRTFITTTSLSLFGALCLGCATGADGPANDDDPRSTAGAQVHTRVLPGTAAASPAGAALEDPGAEEPIAVTRLMTTLHPTAGNAVKGTLAFTLGEGRGLAMEGELEGLPPGSTHAFHLHQFGDCSGADGKTAGAHFNLKGSSESPPKDIQRITGNLGEVVTDADGRATVSATVEAAGIDGPFGVIGRAVVVHARGNDPGKPPMGDTGARLACGVIGIAKAPR